MTGRRTTGIGAILLVAGLGAGLVGCQAVPGEGPVREGLTNLSQAEQPVQFNPDSPKIGADQEEIVRGFVRAAVSGADDYAIAREFLAPEYANQWKPTSGVFVDTGVQPYHSVSDSVGELSLTGVATVDAAGVLTPMAEGPPTLMRFEFTKVAGEWRISSAPNGVILDQSNFTTVWTYRQLYFLTPDNRLVPETRWFLNRATLSTQIVSGLLAGPSEAEAPALRSAFPSGTTLASDAVPVNGETARIEFSPELLTTDPKNLALVQRQLAASLQSVRGVTEFEISVNGAVVKTGPVEAPDAREVSTENMVTTVLRDGKLGTLSGGELEPLPKIGDRIAGLKPDAVSLAADRKSAVVRHRVGKTEAVSWVSQDEIVTLDLRKGLVEPSLDRFGYVWSYASSDPNRILVQLPGSPAARLRLKGVPDRAPLAVRVSPGGNRVAMLFPNSAGNGIVLLASIIRDENAKPVGLGDAVTGMIVQGKPIDLDWIDEGRLVSLSHAGTGGRVTIGPLGQLPLDAGAVPNAVAVSGGGSRALIRVLDDKGELFGPQGSGWQTQSVGVRLIARSG